MMSKTIYPTTCLLLLIVTSLANADLPKNETISLYHQANQQFRQANAAESPDQAKRYYEQAILGFERIINKGKIHNAKLYYNLANAYFLNEQLGKAILNYRRAQRLDNNDENIQKNLAFARSKRIDKIAPKTKKRILHTLFFWHYDFSLRVKLLVACISWAILCLCLTGRIWRGRWSALKGTAILCGMITFCLLISVFIEYRTLANEAGGVITSKEVIAHQGDGVNYPPSFKEPLHEGTEFDLLEQRPGWLHIQLSDGSNGWIVKNCADLI